MNRHRWTGCAVRLGDGQYSNCGYSFGGSWLTAARPAGTADRRISGQPVAAIAAETGLSRHADNTDPSRAQYLRPYLVRAVRRTVSGASCRTRSAPSLTRGAPPPRRGSHRLRRQRCRTNHARPSHGVGTSVYRAMKSLAWSNVRNDWSLPVGIGSPLLQTTNIVAAVASSRSSRGSRNATSRPTRPATSFSSAVCRINSARWSSDARSSGVVISASFSRFKPAAATSILARARLRRLFAGKAPRC